MSWDGEPAANKHTLNVCNNVSITRLESYNTYPHNESIYEGYRSVQNIEPSLTFALHGGGASACGTDGGCHQRRR
jgi:hypothetical protein